MRSFCREEYNESRLISFYDSYYRYYCYFAISMFSTLEFLRDIFAKNKFRNDFSTLSLSARTSFNYISEPIKSTLEYIYKIEYVFFFIHVQIYLFRIQRYLDKNIRV